MDFFIIFVILAVIVCAVLYVTFGKGKKDASGDLAYVQNAALFTPAERSFYTVLLLSIDEDTTIFGKVRVADVLSASKTLDTKLKRSATNKILSKHFDFVLVDSKTLEIKCAIELDDSSHNSKKRQIRDAFLESACKSAELRLVRFKAKRAYKKTEIVQALGFAGQPAEPSEELHVVPKRAPVATVTPTAIPAPKSSTTPTTCPKCGEPLVQKSAKKGQHAGQSFLACSGYPQCRFIRQLAS
jgi:very-short-patch-repair endonuclease